MKPFEYYIASRTDIQVKTKHDFKLPLRHTRCVCSFGILRSRVVASYQHFETTYQSHLQGSSSETTVQNYQSTVHKIPQKECRSQLKTKFLIPVRHKLCYHSCLNIQFHVYHTAPSNHTKMEWNLKTILTHGTYKELMESKLSETYYRMSLSSPLHVIPLIAPSAHSARKVLTRIQLVSSGTAKREFLQTTVVLKPRNVEAIGKSVSWAEQQ